jgi:hypothetical protein
MRQRQKCRSHFSASSKEILSKPILAKINKHERDDSLRVLAGEQEQHMIAVKRHGAIWGPLFLLAALTCPSPPLDGLVQLDPDLSCPPPTSFFFHFSGLMEKST